MGCSSSRDLTPPKTPLEVIEYEEEQRERLDKNIRKEKKQIEKLRKKLEKKRKKQLKKSGRKIRKSNASSKPTTTDIVCSNRNEIEKLKNLDAEIEEETQALINTDLCMFLLNQITFSTEFFANYESELTAILAEFLNKENEFNKNLEDQSILLANPLDAAVQKWIKYKPIHGPNKMQSQLLQTPIIYVVFENIDISRPDDSNYDSIPPLCKVIMETKSYHTTPCREELMQILREIQWKGFVRLKMPENSKSKNSKIQKSDSKIYQKCKGNQNVVYGVTSSGYGTEPEYDYAYITKLNTQKPLNELKLNDATKLKELAGKILPDSCISYLGDYLDIRQMDDSDDDMYELKADGNYELDIDVENRVKPFRNMEALQAIRRYKMEMDRRRSLLQQRYINSQSYMRYFAELMRQGLAKQLSIEAKDLLNATYRGASIFVKDYEIIPAIHVSQNAQLWPECVTQFRLRERPIRKNPRTGENVQWPTRAMIKQIETFGYHVIPLGYAPKRKKNPFRELEWRIVFPKAERYLERHLSYTQVKILMIMKTLVKTFIETKEYGDRLMFVMELLRTHLFWECERNFTIWPEEFLGDVLLRFIDTFKLSLKQKRLRDYFIQERNLLDGIPEQSIMILVSIFADIASNPLMHIMVAFRNLEINEKFFPKLDFKKIFRNLIIENLPKLQELSKNSNFFAETENGSDNDELETVDIDDDPNGLIGISQHEEIAPEKFSRRACQLLYEIEKAKEKKKKRRGSVESIKVEFFFSNNLPERNYESLNVSLEFLRRSNLLETLMDYFITILRKSIKFGNLKLSNAWLMQVKRFVSYYRHYGSQLIAKDYEHTIQLLEDALQELYGNYIGFDEKTNDIASDAEENSKPAQSAEVNPYEEVLPMSENLPTIQNAMKTWEAKLQKKRTEDSKSSKSTIRLSESSMKRKEIQVEIHSRKREKKKTNKSKKSKAKKEINKTEHKKLNTASDEKTTLARNTAEYIYDNKLNTPDSSEKDEHKLEIESKSAISSKSTLDFHRKSIENKRSQLSRTTNSNSISSLEEEVYQHKIELKKNRKTEKSMQSSCSDINYNDQTNAYETETASSTSIYESKIDVVKTRKSKKSRNQVINVSQIEYDNISIAEGLRRRYSSQRSESYSNNKLEILNAKEIKKDSADYICTRYLSEIDNYIGKNEKEALETQNQIRSHEMGQSKSEKVSRRQHKNEANNIIKEKEKSRSPKKIIRTKTSRKQMRSKKISKKSKRKPKQKCKNLNNENFYEAYDNEAYSTISNESVYGSTDEDVKVKFSKNPNKQIMKTTEIITENLDSSSDSKSLKKLKTIISNSKQPRLSVKSQASFKENRRISYEESSREIMDLISNDASASETEHYEFKCLEDLSMKSLLEFQTNIDKKISNNIKDLDTTDLFAYNIVNEKLPTKCNASSKDSENNKESLSSISLQSKAKATNSDQNNWQEIELQTKKIHDDCEKDDDKNEQELKISTQTDNKQTTGTSFFSKYTNRETLLKNFNIISPDMLDTLTESKQKIKDNLSKEKYINIRDALKKRTLEFKKAVLK